MRSLRRYASFRQSMAEQIPAAALTAYAGVQDRMQSLKTGYQFHIAKPVEPGELVMIVANLAGR